jgi:hypothetical protein
MSDRSVCAPLIAGTSRLYLFGYPNTTCLEQANMMLDAKLFPSYNIQFFS